MSTTWTMVVPVISTGHLTPETRKGIEEIEMLEEMELPKDLFDVVSWAFNNGHEWVRLDSDGDRVEDLPYYESK